MSKSKGNVISADELIERVGTDTVRLSTLFVGPPEKDVEWVNRGVEGASRFIHRLWRMVERASALSAGPEQAVPDPESLDEADSELLRKAHWAIKKVMDDVGNRFHFNTAISAVMELVNEMYKCWPEAGVEPAGSTLAVLRFSAETATHLLAPMIPYVCEEMWSMLGHGESIFELPFPEWDADILKTEMVTIVVQVNGKVRANMQAPAGADQEQVEDLARQDPSVRKWIDGKTVRKTVYVGDKLISFVVS